MNIQDITPSMILSVYSGKANACCCGCKGKHRYNPARRDEASKARGYLVTNDEFNAAQVTKVLRTLQANEELVEEVSEGIYSVDVGGKTFTVYLAAEIVAELETRREVEMALESHLGGCE